MNDELEEYPQSEPNVEEVSEPAAENPAEPASDLPVKPKKHGGKILLAVLLSFAAVALIFGVGLFTGMLLFRDRQPKVEETVLSTGQVAEQASPAVVLIRATGSTAVQYGTGFFIRSDGYLLTNYHVVENTKSIQITLYPGDVKKTARLVGYDKDLDLALLHVKGSDFPTVKIGDSGSAAVGDKAVVIGNPSGEKCAWTVTEGIISAKRAFRQETGKETKMIQTDAPVNHGNSGGPLLNDRGEVIGVISQKILDSDNKTTLEGIGLAIPINDAMEIAGQWLDSES